MIALGLLLVSWTSPPRDNRHEAPEMALLGVRPSFSVPFDTRIEWDTKLKAWPYRELTGTYKSSWTRKAIARFTLLQWSWPRCESFHLTHGQKIQLATGQTAYLTREGHTLWLAVKVNGADLALAVRCDQWHGGSSELGSILKSLEISNK